MMGKGVSGRYIPPAEITICDSCFHKDVCGNKDYLTENVCSDKAGGCRCGECKYRESIEGSNDYCALHETFCSKFCGDGKAREAQDDE